MPAVPPRRDAETAAFASPAARAAAGAALFGVTVGLAVGGAYLMGASARGAAVREHAYRFDAAMAAGFTEEALSAAAGGLNESALTIARRHDPYALSGAARRDRQAELLTARLENGRADDAGLRRVGMGALGPAARPFRLEGALDASRDLECLTQAVYYEARGEGRDGMRAVAQVVLNRTRHAAFPKTVCGVVFQGAGRRTGCQFSFTCDGSMRGPVNRVAWNRARDVAAAALNGAVYAPVGSSTHFHTTRVSPGWRGSLIRVAQVGDHVFYRFGGRAGARGAFAHDPQPSARDSAPLLGADVIEASYDPTRQAEPAADAVAAATPAPAEVRPVSPTAAETAPHAAPAARPAPAAPRPTAVSMTAPTHESAAPAA